MKQIIVTVDVNGKTEVSAAGVKGKGCEKLTKVIEDAIGTGGKSKKLPEYYEEDKATIKAGA